MRIFLHARKERRGERGGAPHNAIFSSHKCCVRIMQFMSVTVYIGIVACCVLLCSFLYCSSLFQYHANCPANPLTFAHSFVGGFLIAIKLKDGSSDVCMFVK